jgi:PAS domain S-box-containing protein
MHLYYLPLVLIGYYYRRRGIPLILILAGTYFALAVFFLYPSLVEIESAGLRAAMFIIIGVIVAVLSEHLKKETADYRNLFTRMIGGGALHEMVYDSYGNPVNYRIIDVNPAFETITGIRRESSVGKTSTEVYGVDTPPFLDLYARVAATGQPEVVEEYFAPMEKHFAISVYSPEKGRFVTIFEDITGRKQIEEELHESEAKFRGIFDTINDGIHIHEIEPDGSPGRFIEVNEVACRMLQYTRDELIRQGPLDFVTGYYNRPFLEIIAELSTTGHSFFETEHRRKDKTIIPVEINAHVTTLDGKKVGVSVIRDITQRKLMEHEIRESGRRLMDIINFLPDPTFVIDTGGTVIAWNKAIQFLTGVPAQEMIGKGNYEYSYHLFGKRRPLLIDLVLHSDEQVRKAHYPDLIEKDGMLSGQMKIRSLKGKPSFLWIIATPLRNESGETVGAIESIRDITGIKKIESDLKDLNLTLEQRVQDRTRELEDAMNYTRSLIEADLDPLILIDADGRIRDVNRASEKMTGRDRESLLGTLFVDYIENKELATTGFETVLRDGNATGNRYAILHRDGHTIPVIAGSALYRDSEGSVRGIFITLHDITQILHDEQLIDAQLAEKEVLLREIHHRVKNNLQIIGSLIHLQSQSIRDPAIVEALNDTQNRVRAIALVHERLHMSKDLARVDFGAYVRYLGSNLFAFYQKDPSAIRMVYEAEKVIIDIDTAAPLGLIFNELISNMLKYAFPDGRMGECTISAHREEKNLVLKICDDGVGMPADFDWNTSPTLGLKLVHLLVEQLKGTISLDTVNGTCFTLTIPVNDRTEEIHHVG